MCFKTEAMVGRSLTLPGSNPTCVRLNRTPYRKGDETMQARVTLTQILPDKMDQATAIYRDSVVPAGQQQKGFKGALLLANHGTGRGISITMWESEADMIAGESSGYYQQQLAKFKDVFGAPPVREQYEVTVQV